MRPDKVKYQGNNYYIIPADYVKYMVISLLIFIILLTNVGNIMKKIKTNQELTSHEYEDMESSLWNKEYCYICGDRNGSLKIGYGKNGTLGILCLNKIRVLDLEIITSDTAKYNSSLDGHLYKYAGNVGSMNYLMSQNLVDKECDVELFVSEENQLNPSEMKKQLCQSCLDKVSRTLETNKLDKDEWLFPACLIDFKTLEIYALQRWNTQYRIRDFEVDIDYTENEILMHAAAVN